MKSMASRTSSVVPWRYRQISALLRSVLLEWVLMLLLLLEGLLSYLATSFARLCELRPPCPMCTRLDHVLGTGFYGELMCSSHKAEASSWAFCRVHHKLVDVHSMCETCLFSFAADGKSNLETYRCLMGKLGVGAENPGFSLRYDAREAPVMTKKDTTTDLCCSCCSRSLKLKPPHPFAVLQDEEASGIFGHDEVCRGVSRFRHRRVDGISYAAYSELKTSDSESEPCWQLGGGDDEALQKDVGSNYLKEDTTPLYDNPQPQEKIPGPSELIVALNGGSYSTPSESTGEMCNIHTDGEANIQSTDLPITDGQRITEDSDTRDKSENDVWHSSLGCTKELSATATTSAETDTVQGKNKAEFTQMHGDLKLLLSQLSNTSIAPADTDNISRSLSFQRKNDSGFSERTVHDEAEADEYTTDQLKRQIESDRESIRRLWTELEEERNASAVAANQTMAMITRLQEERAATQMEAAQYRRMVEEQSAYDRENLRKMTETVRALQQAEVERYEAKKLADGLLVDEIRDHMRLLPCPPEEHRSVVSCFEDEQAYIAKRLVKLKQKLHRFSNNSKHIVVPVSKLDDDDERDSVNADDGVHEDDDVEQGGKKYYSVFRRNGSGFRDYLTHGNKDDPEPKGRQYHATVGETDDDLACFEGEISEVSGRLVALEADMNFLEHSVNSLRNGGRDEGEELVRDIAFSLSEIRKMGVAWKKNN